MVLLSCLVWAGKLKKWSKNFQKKLKKNRFLKNALQNRFRFGRKSYPKNMVCNRDYVAMMVIDLWPGGRTGWLCPWEPPWFKHPRIDCPKFYRLFLISDYGFSYCKDNSFDIIIPISSLHIAQYWRHRDKVCSIFDCKPSINAGASLHESSKNFSCETPERKSDADRPACPRRRAPSESDRSYCRKKRNRWCDNEDK